MKVKCMICGATFNDSEENCPVCGVGREFFEPLEEESKTNTSTNQSNNYNIVIIGGGIAGMTVATELRKKSGNSKITMIYNEPYLPYQRPLLTKKLFSLDDKVVLEDRYFYEKENIELINEKAIEINFEEKEVYLESNKIVKYDKLVIASGSRSFLPDLPGNKLEGVFTLRTLTDALNIVNYSKNKNKVVIVGGGVLGLEAAISFKKANKEVAILESGDRLMKRQLDEKGSNYLLNYLNEKGITVLLEARTTKIEEGLKLFYNDSKEVLDADMILFSTGIRGNKDLISNLEVTEYLETQYQGVYVCGDIISKYGLWTEATKMGKIVANNILEENEKEIYQEIEPYLTTKLDELNVLKIGEESNDDIEFSNKDNYLKYYFKDDMIVGAILVSKENEMDEVLNNYYQKASSIKERLKKKFDSLHK